MACALAALLALSSTRSFAADGDVAAGIRLFEEGRWDEARDVLSTATDRDGASAEVLYSLGVAAARSGDDEAAIAALTEALKTDPAFPGVRLELGMAYFRQKRFELAAETLDAHLADDPRDGAALLFRGMAEQGLERHETAVPYFEAAAEADPDFRQLGLYNAGLSLYRAGHLTTAEKRLTAALGAGDDAEIAAATQGLLDALKKEEARQAAKAWTATVRYGYQFDDSVTTDETDTSSGKKDHAQVIEVGGAWKILKEDEPFALEAGYNFSQTLHNRQGEYDIQSHLLSLSADKEVAGVDTGLSVQYNRTFLGGDDFLGSLSAIPSIGGSVRDGWYVNTSYTFVRKNFMHSDDRDAVQHALGIDNFVFPFDDVKSYLSFSYRIEKENTRSPEYDYLGHSLGAGLNVALPLLPEDSVANLGYSFSLDDYDNVTESIGSERLDKRHTVSIGLTVPLVPHVEGAFDYQYIDAISNLESSDYRENIVTATVEVGF